MFGIVSGYVVCLFPGLINFQPVLDAKWFELPQLTKPEFNLEAILYMLNQAIAPAVEHVGGIMAISSVTGKDFLKNQAYIAPYQGDGVATAAASLVGGPPNTTYAEATGAVMLTRNFNPNIMTWAVVWAIVISFCGKVGAFLSTIPTIVMGHYDVGIRFDCRCWMSTLIKGKVDVTEPRNLLYHFCGDDFGIGNMFVNVGDVVSPKRISLCAIVAIVLNLDFAKSKNEVE